LHLQVKNSTEVGAIIVWNDHLAEQQLSMFWNGAAAAFEDDDSMLVVPVVNDVLENVSIGTRRNGLEKVSTHQLATRYHTLCFKEALGLGNHMRAVEERRSHAWILLEQCRSEEHTSELQSQSN